MNRSRRLIVSASALGCALVLFHGQLASAVVTRADDALRSGDVSGAIRLYERAGQLDPYSGLAADRLAFYLALRHDRANAGRAVVVATRALSGGATDTALLADRAFAEVQLQGWGDAQRDFAAAGALAHDPRYDQFAARMAIRNGDRRAARRLALRALTDDPAFTPARALLRSLR